MVVMPAVMPYTMPDVVPIVAIVVFVLLHIPPLLASLKVVVAAVQTCIVPAIAGGNGLTVTITLTGAQLPARA